MFRIAQFESTGVTILIVNKTQIKGTQFLFYFTDLRGFWLRSLESDFFSA
jgi:hypothetical protein